MSLGNLIKPQYRITVIILDERGQAVSHKINLDEPEGTFKEGSTEYRITRSGLYEKAPLFFTRPIFSAMRIRFYWILFNEGQETHIKPSDPLIGPRDLYVMANSRILKKALAEILRSGGLSSKLLLVLLFLAIIIIYYLFTGVNFQL